MAPRKKPLQRRNPQSPNTVLVVFLVFFVLLSIGLGVWGYYGYAGQKDFEKKAENANVAAKAAKKGAEWDAFQAYDARASLGENLLMEADLDEKVAWENARKDFFDAEGKPNPATKFKDFKNKDAIEKMIEMNVKLLGWDAGGNKYKTTYRDELTRLQKEVEKLKGDVADAMTKKDEAEKKAQDLITKYDPLWEQLIAQVKDGNAKTLKAATGKTVEMDDLLALTVKLRQDMTAQKDDHEKAVRGKEREIQELKVKLEAARNVAEMPANAPAAARPAGGGGDVHALALDISQGKPLWDVPQGKILRVEPQGRRIYIDRGSAHGIQPQMTFTVFGAGWKGKAEGLMKGTVEVQTVLDNGTSVARVTSLFDANGREIPLGDTTRGVYSREAENPLKEGDLLFNLAWGVHVAIAGHVSWDGYDPEAPAEQMRHLQRFIALLRKQGITVDAYLDLTDGQMKGTITPQAGYLIRGFIPEPPPGGDKDGKDKLTKAIDEGIRAMKNEAVERGMFVISSDNFLNVIGYRRPHSASDAQVSAFRPSPPSAGAGPAN